MKGAGQRGGKMVGEEGRRTYMRGEEQTGEEKEREGDIWGEM